MSNRSAPMTGRQHPKEMSTLGCRDGKRRNGSKPLDAACVRVHVFHMHLCAHTPSTPWLSLLWLCSPRRGSSSSLHRKQLRLGLLSLTLPLLLPPPFIEQEFCSRSIAFLHSARSEGAINVSLFLLAVVSLKKQLLL